VLDRLNVETCDQPARIGDRCFFRRRCKDQEQSCLYVREDTTGEDRLLIDPSGQGPYTSAAICRISEDGRILAFAIKSGGERTEAIRFVNVSSGIILEDQLEAGYMRGLAFASDNSGFYYCHEFVQSRHKAGSHEIRYHHFGDATDQDHVLFSLPRTPRSKLLLISDNTNLGASFVRDCGGELKVDLCVSPRIDDRHWRLVSRDNAMPCAPFLNDGRIYMASFAGEPNGQIIEQTEDSREMPVTIPAWHTPIGGLRCTGDSLYISYLVDFKTVIRRWSLSGEDLGCLPAHPEGSFGLLPAYSNGNNSLFFIHESFSEPPTILEYCEATKSYVRWANQAHTNAAGQYRIRRVTYPSSDGTQIPMSMVALDDADPSASRPVVMTGYGGFGISMSPQYSVLVALMLEFGCVFAIPNIRGGSEFGREWHEAARRRNRQVAYDDFLSAAEWLCANKITRPECLAIFGGSNSGLLVAAAMTQRPELFRAVLCVAPILDMLRFEHFSVANKWREEYGTPEDADDFMALYAYSPYHRVREDVNYPATMFVTGDKDTQCDPAHVRKMAARMQGRNAQTRPVLVDYCSERGHTPNLPLSVRIDALTRRLAFLLHELRIPIAKEKSR